ncbi:hypothetical protein [Hydrogenimonas urashimensis]|uniref:hypothetical protein n=1 Tax=Hydrogenimonas urashimensis TaxID=2740515 RepID=UPI001916608E|nr:hypothetical protein [Hydrogenimonas urashimensis]
MKKFVLILALVIFAFAIDWSERSTQELIAALKYEKSGNIPVILHELKKREVTMTPEEKRAYEEAKKKIEDAGKN